MLNPVEFRSHVIRPALMKLGLHSRAAEVLLLGTALTESRLSSLVQTNGGPALGLYQIEPRTHGDIWRNYLAFRPKLAARVLRFSAAPAGHAQLIWNLAYATVIARLIYRRVSADLPASDDPAALARYWKAHFNTPAGKGRIQDFIARAGPYLIDDATRRIS